MERSHYIYIAGLAIIGLISAFVLITVPHGAPVPTLSSQFFLFGLGMSTTTLLWSIGGFLLYRWYKGKRTNQTLLAWGLSFFVFSITFVAHMFRALGFADANENTSTLHFFAYRWVMPVFSAGIIFGLTRLLVEKRKYQVIPTLLSLGIGLLWLVLGLFVIPSPSPIEATMYLFLYTVWIPVCFTMAYVFAYFGWKAQYRGPLLVAFGFIILMISYFAWAPWHFTDVVYIYFVWYFVFMLSLIPVLIGFVVLSLEEKFRSTS